MTPEQRALRDAYLAEMWPTVREYHDPMPSVIPQLYDAPRNGCPQDAGNGGENVDRRAS